jgi:hypothetical protein
VQEAEHRRVLPRGRALHEVLEVVAGGEDLRQPMDQHHAHRPVLLGGAEGAGELLVHARRDRVAARGTIEGDARDRALARGDDVGVHA